MAKLKPASVGLALGLMLAILYTIRAIVLLLFPNFAVNVAKKVVNNVISIQPPVITSDSYVIGVVVVFIAGLVWESFSHGYTIGFQSDIFQNL